MQTTQQGVSFLELTKWVKSRGEEMELTRLGAFGVSVIKMNNVRY